MAADSTRLHQVSVDVDLMRSFSLFQGRPTCCILLLVAALVAAVADKPGIQVAGTVIVFLTLTSLAFNVSIHRRCLWGGLLCLPAS